MSPWDEHIVARIHFDAVNTPTDCSHGKPTGKVKTLFQFENIVVAVNNNDADREFLST